MKFLRWSPLFLILFSLTSCAHAPKAQYPTRSTEYFQTYTFQAKPEDVLRAAREVLQTKKYEILSEEPSQITAINSDVTSVQILTYSREHSSFLHSVYAGEIKLVVDVSALPQGGTFINLRAAIRAIKGRNAFLKNKDWQGEDMAFTSRGKLENEILQAVARSLKDKDALARLVTRSVELEGGFTLQ